LYIHEGICLINLSMLQFSHSKSQVWAVTAVVTAVAVQVAALARRYPLHRLPTQSPLLPLAILQQDPVALLRLCLMSSSVNCKACPDLSDDTSVSRYLLLKRAIPK
jgi:hypothetical protein